MTTHNPSEANPRWGLLGILFGLLGVWVAGA